MGGLPPNDLSSIASLARQLIDEYGLTDWTFQWDSAKRRAGICRYGRKTIGLNRYYATHNSLENVKDTILHEIAHALAGPGAGHGPEWRRVCCQIGARPERCYDSAQVKMPEKKYKATCPSCGKVFGRHRQVKRGRWMYCLKCGRDRGRLTYIAQ